MILQEGRCEISKTRTLDFKNADFKELEGNSRSGCVDHQLKEKAI